MAVGCDCVFECIHVPCKLCASVQHAEKAAVRVRQTQPKARKQPSSCGHLCWGGRSAKTPRAATTVLSKPSGAAKNEVVRGLELRQPGRKPVVAVELPPALVADPAGCHRLALLVEQRALRIGWPVQVSPVSQHVQRSIKFPPLCYLAVYGMPTFSVWWR
eukprot:COSAG03_NODE_1493_length_3981_cov_6.421175_4_plen_160_part_00